MSEASQPSGNRLRDVFWYGRSIRQQVLLAISIMLIVATALAGTTAVVNGRRSVNVEMEASMDTAEGYLREMVRRVKAENQLDALDSLVAKEVQHLRHARVYVRDKDNKLRMLQSPPSLAEARAQAERPPDWFYQLMLPVNGKERARVLDVEPNGRSLVLKGDPDDEIVEKWDELSALAIVALILVGLLVAAFDFVLRRILDPLVGLANGLVALEVGERFQRLKIPRVREVADIAGKFNSLAASLDQARSENGELYRQIQSVQEDERREIARELHDEVGPCLFGITANVESVASLTRGLPDDGAKRIHERTGEILAITDRLKIMNRALLKRLHPVSLGKVPLSAVVQDLVFDFARRHPGVSIVSTIAPMIRTYGERIDLTVYRSTQEALTNALRHGQAKHIVVSLSEEKSNHIFAGGDCPVVIVLRVSDDGLGLKPGVEAGFGLSAMRERVLSAGGSLNIEDHEPSGTVISIRIPARPSDLGRRTLYDTDRATA